MPVNKILLRQRAGADYLYLLAWQDTLESLDALILEIRHLQVNIIHALREPVLYRALRFEEFFLWSSSEWEQHLLHGNASKRTASLARHWIRTFPLPKDLTSNENTPTSGNNDKPAENDSEFEEQQWEKIGGEIDQYIIKRVRKIWLRGIWGREQRRHYHSLCGLQILKQQIFRDKLFLCRYALENRIDEKIRIKDDARSAMHPDFHIIKENNPLAKAQFMILRAGIQERMEDYVDRSRNFKGAYNFSVDTGQGDYPSPNIQRRREMGIYMDFLSRRTRELSRDMNLFMHQVFDISCDYYETKLIFHRWRHDIGSRIDSYEDEVGRKVSKQKTQLSFVTTGFNMPERPDLQPIIAHEVAHEIVRNHWMNLQGIGAAASSDAFSGLLIMIKKTITNFEWELARENLEPLQTSSPESKPSVNNSGDQVQDENFETLSSFESALKSHQRYQTASDIRTKTNYLVNEIACDFLAAAVKGHSYLYAAFLQMAGSNLTFLLLDGGEVDIKLIDDMRGIKSQDYDKNRDWILRITLLSTWIEAIHHHKPEETDEEELDSLLIEGVRTVTQDIVELLDSLLPSKYKYLANQRRELADQLQALVKEFGLENDKYTTAEMVMNWRKKRCKDGEWTDANSENKAPSPWRKYEEWTDTINGENRIAPKREMPRSMEKLDRRVRDFLYEVQLGMKCSQGRLLHDSWIHMSHKFAKKYKGSNPSETALDELRQEINRKFSDTYKVRHHVLSVDDEQSAVKRKREGVPFLNMYRHLYDIPWQSAIMRAMDVIERKDGTPNNKTQLLYELHHDFALGRELFSIGLEFYLRDTETSIKRLQNVTRLVHNLLDYHDGKSRITKNDDTAGNIISEGVKEWNVKSEDDVGNIFIIELRKWLDKKNGSSNSDEAEILREHIIKTSIRDINSSTSNDIISKFKVTASKLIYIDGRIDALDAKEKRKVSRIAGLLLEQLYQGILLEYCTDAPYFQPLIKYLSIRSDEKYHRKSGKKEPPKAHSSLFEALTQSKSGTLSAKGYPKNIQSFVVGRISTAGSYSLLTAENMINTPLKRKENAALRIFDYISGPNKSKTYQHGALNSPSKTGKVQSVSLLGRYDILQWGETTSLCRCPIPFFSISEEEGVEQAQAPLVNNSLDITTSAEERFPTFFQRREMAFKACLGPNPASSSSKKSEYRIYGILAITLQKPTFRLDFLYRLIEAFKHSDGTKEPKVIEQFSTALIHGEAFALLSDGWGDVLLYFSDKINTIKTKHIESLYEVQKVVYEDFMVDRTEIILTDEAESGFTSRTGKKRFSISTDMRLMEDRQLHPSDEIFDNLAKSAGIKMKRIPGRMDFRIDFKASDTNIASSIKELVSSPLLDRIDTSVGYRKKNKKK